MHNIFNDLKFDYLPIKKNRERLVRISYQPVTTGRFDPFDRESLFVLIS